MFIILYIFCAIICSVFIQRGQSLRPILNFYNSKLISKSFGSSALYSSESSESTSAPSASTSTPVKKGFGKSKLVEKEEDVPEVGTKTYDLQAKRGVPEYNIFIRPANGTDTEWIPVGSMVSFNL